MAPPTGPSVHNYTVLCAAIRIKLYFCIVVYFTIQCVLDFVECEMVFSQSIQCFRFVPRIPLESRLPFDVLNPVHEYLWPVRAKTHSLRYSEQLLNKCGGDP